MFANLKKLIVTLSTVPGMHIAAEVFALAMDELDKVEESIRELERVEFDREQYQLEQSEWSEE